MRGILSRGIKEWLKNVTWSDVGASLILLFIFVFLSRAPLWHTDVWGHLQAGRTLRTERQWFEIEPNLAYSDKSQQYAHFQWLSQVTYAEVYDWGSSWAGGDRLQKLRGGAEMVRSVRTVIVLLRFLFLYLAFRRLTRGSLWACLALGLAFCLSWPFFYYARPRDAGELCFAIVLFCLSWETLPRWAIAVIPCSMIVWANSHGAFGVGLATVGLALLGTALATWKQGDRKGLSWIWTESSVRRLLLAMVCAVVGIACLNPHGPKLYLLVLQMSKNPNLKDFTEWYGLWKDVLSLGGVRYAVSTLLLATTWAIAKQSSGRAASPKQLLLLLLAAGPWYVVRMLTWWLPVSVWLAVPMWVNPKAEEKSVPTEAAPSWGGVKVALILLVIGCGVCYFHPTQWWIRGEPPFPLEKVLSAETPWRLAEQIQQSRSSSKQEPVYPAFQTALDQSEDYQGKYVGEVFGSESQGDYLDYALPKDIPVFVTTHIHLFSPEHWQKAKNVKFVENDWEATLDRHKINLIVVERRRHKALIRQLKQNSAWSQIPSPPGNPEVFVALRDKPLQK